MGGQAEALTTSLKQTFTDGLSLSDAIGVAVRALGSVGGEGGAPRELAAAQLEVAVLDRTRTQRLFKRITGAALTAALPAAPAAGEPAEVPATDAPADTPAEE